MSTDTPTPRTDGFISRVPCGQEGIDFARSLERANAGLRAELANASEQIRCIAESRDELAAFLARERAENAGLRGKMERLGNMVDRITKFRAAKDMLRCEEQLYDYIRAILNEGSK